MPVFSYKAFDHSGNVLQGNLDARSAAEAREALRGKKLIPTDISLITDINFLAFLSSFVQGSVSLKQKIQFTHQLAVLLKAGIPLLDAVSLLTRQFEGPFKLILNEIKDSLESGESLATALEKNPAVFSHTYTHLVRAGEASGNLETILERLTQFMERAAETSKKISSAMVNPIFMMVLIMVVIIVSTVWIIPSMAGVLGQTGKQLPAITEMMLSFSWVISSFWHLILLFLGSFYLAFRFWKATDSGQLFLHKLILRIPRVSGFVKSKAVVQFSQTLGMLLEAGVTLSEALDIVSTSVDNGVLKKTLQQAKDNIVKEGKMAKHLSETGIFPPVPIHMIKTGEESGNLADMLTKVGNDADADLLESTNVLVQAINPVMTVVVAAVVLVVVLSIFLPIMELSDLGNMA